MNLKTKIKEVKKGYYEITFKTYKETMVVTLERSEVRELIGKLDNAI